MKIERIRKMIAEASQYRLLIKIITANLGDFYVVTEDVTTITRVILKATNLIYREDYLIIMNDIEPLYDRRLGEHFNIYEKDLPKVDIKINKREIYIIEEEIRGIEVVYTNWGDWYVLAEF